MDLRPLTDAELLSRLDALVAQERESVADVVEHLAEIERRKSILATGCNSLYDYLVRKLRYSEAAAFARIRAARASLTDDRVIRGLRTGGLHLDAVAHLAPHMTKENSEHLLDLASGATSRDVRSLVTSLSEKKAPEKDVVRIVASQPLREDAQVIPPPSRLRFGFTADTEFALLLDRLRAERRHAHPEGRLEDILKDAVRAYLERLDAERQRESRKRFRKPRTRRWIPRSVKKEVWARDGGRCSFVGPDGTRCDSRHFLEYDHIVPFSLGGRSDAASNIRLLCRPHNQHAARRAGVAADHVCSNTHGQQPPAPSTGLGAP